MFKKIIGASLVLAAILVLPFDASAATVSVSGTPTLGLASSISGVCDATPAGGTVSVSLVRGSTTVANLGTVATTGSNGDFSGTFAIPNNIGGGPVTIVATCPNGTATVNSSIFDPLANVTVSDTSPRIGTGFTVAGVCGTTAGGNVSFLLSNPNSQIVIGGTTTAANGAFSSVLTIPTNFPTGSATLVGFCPTGNIMTTSVVVDPSATGGTVNLPTGSTGTTTGTVGGVSTAPTGGVAAGRTENTLAFAGLLFILLSAVGLVLTKKLQSGYDL